MKRFAVLLVTIFSLVLITGCAKTSNLVGTWNGDTEDGLNTTFEFKKNGDVKYYNEYGFDSTGTYEIKDDIVTINLESWSEAKKYKFEIKDKKLSLTAQDAYSPSYTEMLKK